MIDPSISLAVKTPQFNDPLETAGKVLSIRQMQQGAQLNAEKLKAEQLQNQETELKRKDDQIASQTFLQAGGDPAKHVQMMAQAGARPQAVQATQTHYGEIAKKTADTSKTDLENQAKRNEMLLPLHDQAIQLAQSNPQAYQQAWPQILQQAAAIDPEAAKHFSPDQPPTVEQLTASKNLHVMQDYLIKGTAEQRAQAEEARKAAKAAPELAKAAADATVAQQTATGTKPIQPEEQARMDLQKRAQEQTAIHNAATEKNATALLKINQGHLAVSQQQADIAKKIYEQTYGEGANPALVGVEPKLRAKAASDAQKYADEFTKANEAAATMKTIIDQARAGNKVAYAYAPTTGVLTINTANGVKRVNMAEIKSYSGAGSAVDAVEGWLGKQVSGASIPKNILDNMEQLHGQLAQNSVKKYNDSLSGLNQNYRSNFKPVQGAEPKSAGAMIRARDPQGKLHEAPAGTPLPAGWTEQK